MSKINDNRRTLGTKFENQEKQRRELAGKTVETPKPEPANEPEIRFNISQGIRE